MSPQAQLRTSASYMNEISLAAEEQDLIDRWVDSALGGHPLSSDELDHFEQFMTGIHEGASDLWNSDWPGFHTRTTLGSYTLLEDALQAAFDAGGVPGTDDYEEQNAISEFRSQLENCWERNPGCGLIEIRDRLEGSAWIGFDQGDWGELEGVWVCSSPESLEAAYRSNGYIFPNDIPPSGLIDEYTDDQIRQLLADAAPQALKELEYQQQRYQAEQEKKRLRREAAKARRTAKQEVVPGCKRWSKTA